jgi:hypothetical protein
MGRPRKLPADRLSRYVQARVTDYQWNWLEYRAREDFEGDLSKALRSSIDHSVMLGEILRATDPHAKLDELLERRIDDADLELYMDEEPEHAA